MNEREIALVAWLALEREAVWLYPYLGARVPELADRARTSLTAHQKVRDRLTTLVADDPTRSEPAYDVGPISTRKQAEVAAQRLERRIQAACLTLVRVAAPDDRTSALASLRAAALAELTWGGSATPYPGLD